MRGLEFRPVEFDADPGARRYPGQVVVDDQRACRIGVDWKAVRLDPSGIGTGGDQADVKLLDAVAADRDPQLQRPLRHLQPTGRFEERLALTP